MIDITIEHHRYSPSFLIPITFHHLFGISQAAPRCLRSQGPQVSQQELRHVQRIHRRCVAQTWRSGTSPWVQKDGGVGPLKLETFMDFAGKNGEIHGFGWEKWRNSWILLGKSDMKYENYRIIGMKA